MNKIARLMLLSTAIFTPVAFSAPAGTLSVHILNQQTGIPSRDVDVTLEKQQPTGWDMLAKGKTDNDGRIKSLYPEDKDMQPGVYRVTFKTGDYFKSEKLSSFFPEVPVFGLTPPR